MESRINVQYTVNKYAELGQSKQTKQKVPDFGIPPIFCMYAVNHQMLYYASVPLSTTGVCSLSTHPTKVPLNKVSMFSVLVTHQVCTKSMFSHVPCAPPKNEKCQGWPLFTDIGPPCAPWCTTKVGDAGRWCTMLNHWSGAQRSSHKPRQTHSDAYEPTVQIHRWAQQTVQSPSKINS